MSKDSGRKPGVFPDTEKGGEIQLRAFREGENGPLMDVSMAPHDVQIVASEKGLIPYIRADRWKALKSDDQ